MTKCDDNSGYDHLLLSQSSQTYFGFSFGGLCLVCTTLPFGWKVFPSLYHSFGLSASGFLRAKGVPCSVYIDDCLNGLLITSSLLPARKDKTVPATRARTALFVLLSVLVGYTIGIKSLLSPTTTLEPQGFVIDSEKQAFLISRRKIELFAVLRENILACKSSIGLKTLQRFQGKC